MPSVLELAVFGGFSLTCGKCGRTVPYGRFSPSHGMCRDCRNAMKREQRERKKERDDEQ